MSGNAAAFEAAIRFVFGIGLADHQVYFDHGVDAFGNLQLRHGGTFGSHHALHCFENRNLM